MFPSNKNVLEVFIFKNILMVLSVSLFVLSCTQPTATDGKIQIGRNGAALSAHIPFASDQALAQIDETEDESIVPWRLARRFAHVELRGNHQSNFGWEGSTLSERPVVVYDGNSKPKYYEFIVFDFRKAAIATITTYATKSTSSIISNFLPYVRSYPLLSKSPGYAEIDIMYPRSMLVGVKGKAGDEPVGLIDPDTGESTDLFVSVDTEEMFAQMRDMSDEELLGHYGLDGRSDLEGKIAEHWIQEMEWESETESFWDMIDENAENILQFTDAQVDEKFLLSKSTSWKSRSRVLYEGDYNDLEKMPAVFRTRWDGWCVPSAMAWVYFAEKFNNRTYNGVALPDVDQESFEITDKRKRDSETDPKHGDHFDIVRKDGKGGEHTVSERVKKQTGYYNFMGNFPETKGSKGDASLNKGKVRARSKEIDGGLYADLMEWGYSYASKGGTWDGHYYTMAKNMTNGKRGIYYTALWDNVHSNIFRNKKPVFLSATFSNKKGGKDKRHFITLTGTIQIDRYWWWWFIFRFTGTARERRMYMVHDNGSVTTRDRLRLPAAGSHKAGRFEYRNPYRNVKYYPYWFDEKQIYDLTTFPYLFK